MPDTASQLVEQPVTELVVPETVTALEVFSAPEGLDPYIELAREFVAVQVPDTSTNKGRKAIASTARKVAKLKTKLDAMGKDLVSDWKAKAKAVDSSRKSMRDQLDALRDEARAPLDEWKAADAQRIDRLKRGITRLETWLEGIPGCLDRDEIGVTQTLIAEKRNGDYQEFQLKADLLFEQLDAAIKARIDVIDEQERVAKEIEAQRIEQERIATEQRIAAEKLEAEREQLRLEQEKLEHEKADAAERARLADKREAQIRADAEAAEKAEANRIESERVAPIKVELNLLRNLAQEAEESTTRSGLVSIAQQIASDAFDYQDYDFDAKELHTMVLAIVDRRIAELDEQDKQAAEAEEKRKADEAAQIKKRKQELEACCRETFEALRPFCTSKTAANRLIDAITVGNIPHVRSELV